MEEGRIVGDTDYRGKARVQTINDLPSMTIQSDAHMADIHNILAQYGQGGMQQLDDTALMFKDVSEFTDLQDALNQVKIAEVEFMKLHPRVRSIFKNDVAVWLDSAHDEEKRDALIEAGFLDPLEVVEAGGKGGADGAAGTKSVPEEGTSSEGSE